MIKGKRDVNSLDLNNDGHVDIEELAKVIDEREARDLIESMSEFCKCSVLYIRPSCTTAPLSARLP